MVSINGNAERFTEIAALARRFPGRADRVHRRQRQSVYRRVRRNRRCRAGPVRELRHPARSRVTLEERSRNTEENARFTKTLIEPKPGERWLLVTSAIHMPRSVGASAGWTSRSKPIRSIGATDAGWKRAGGLPPAGLAPLATV